MNLYRSPAHKPASPAHVVRRRLETLEDRTVPATISIAGATAVEGGTAYRFTDNFVAPDGYGLSHSRVVLVGPDGNVYVANLDTNSVKVFEGGTGRYLRDLSTPGSELGPPWTMTFGPDGRLYVHTANTGPHNVVRFNIGDGSSEVFVAAGSGGLGNSHGMTFGPDGNLYVATAPPTGSLALVKRFDGATGAYIDDFVALGSGGLQTAQGVVFGPDGNLYVASRVTHEVKRYNGQTGAFLGNFVTAESGGMTDPGQLLFRDGFLYVSSHSNTPNIYRFNATTGAFVDVFTSSPTGRGSFGMAFGASGEFYVSLTAETVTPMSTVARFAPSSFAALTVTLDVPSATPVTVQFTTGNGTAVVGSDFVATSGTLTFAPGQTTRTILVPTVNDDTAEPAETFTVTLSGATGATIADGTATGTIRDDDATQFFVVNDAAADTSYQYGLLGKATGNTGLTAGNTAPRGAASTAAGTKVWVADANKTVYVYSTAGTLLGSWAALDMPKNANVEGVAVWGNDVWVLVNSPNKDAVYRYAGAASRLSGSQRATSSFALNNADTNPKGIVTDGTSFWVVDDGSSTDRVFKYTLTGGLLGSWTIDAANRNPTGLTIDPTDVGDIWVVDNGTDRVYQYTAAVGRTSGSQAAAATFALAAGNTNPQDIADPPPPAWMLPNDDRGRSSGGRAAAVGPAAGNRSKPARGAWLAAVDLGADAAADPLGITPIAVGKRRR